MKRKNKFVCGMIFFLFFFTISNIAKADFETWVGASNLFTIGKPELVNIYVRNNELTEDSYNITYTKYATRGLINVSHLVTVSIPSYKIKTLTTNETGDTFATITLLGPIDSGTVTFNITSDKNPTYHEVTITLSTGYPIALSEFDFSGLIQILLITVLILVVSYASHFS